MKLRPSTLALLIVNASALSAIAWTLAAPAEPQWLAPEPTAQAYDRAPPAPLPALSDALRAMTWTHPVFSPDRQPDPRSSTVTAQPLSGLTLTGVLLDRAVQWAYLRDARQRAIKLAVGTALDSGWILSQLDARSATFTREGQSHTLNMPVPRLPPPSNAPLLTLPRTQTP